MLSKELNLLVSHLTVSCRSSPPKAQSDDSHGSRRLSDYDFVVSIKDRYWSLVTNSCIGKAIVLYCIPIAVPVVCVRRVWLQCRFVL